MEAPRNKNGRRNQRPSLKKRDAMKWAIARLQFTPRIGIRGWDGPARSPPHDHFAQTVTHPLLVLMRLMATRIVFVAPSSPILKSRSTLRS